MTKHPDGQRPLERFRQLLGEATARPWKTHAPWSIGKPRQTCVSQVKTKQFPATPAVCQTEADAALIDKETP
jgi:hypothetical protein